MIRRVGLPLAILLALVGAWQAGVAVFGVEDYLLPSPSQVADSLWTDRALFAPDAWVTLREVIAGFGVAVVVGLAFASALHLSPLLRRAFYPLLVASQTIPIVAIAPILVVWWGFGLGPKLAIIALVCFFPICVNVLDGLRSVDRSALTLMRTLDASRWQIFTRVEAPAALPFFFSGAKVAVAVAVIGAVFGEWAGSESGLGHLMISANSQFLTARLFGAVILLGLIAVALFGALSALERRIIDWSPGELSG